MMFLWLTAGNSNVISAWASFKNLNVRVGTDHTNKTMSIAQMSTPTSKFIISSMWELIYSSRKSNIGNISPEVQVPLMQRCFKQIKMLSDTLIRGKIKYKLAFCLCTMSAYGSYCMGWIKGRVRQQHVAVKATVAHEKILQISCN